MSNSDSIYKISQIDVAAIELLSNNIFLITVTSGATVDLDAAKRLICAINEMLPNDKEYRAGIFDLSNMAHVEADAGLYLVSGTDLKGIVSGVALVSTTDQGRTIGDMVVSIHNPQIFPIRCFNSPMRAEHWVRTNMKNALANVSFAEGFSVCKNVA